MPRVLLLPTAVHMLAKLQNICSLPALLVVMPMFPPVAYGSHANATAHGVRCTKHRYGPDWECPPRACLPRSNRTGGSCSCSALEDRVISAEQVIAMRLCLPQVRHQGLQPASLPQFPASHTPALHPDLLQCINSCSRTHSASVRTHDSFMQASAL